LNNKAVGMGQEVARGGEKTFGLAKEKNTTEDEEKRERKRKKGSRKIRQLHVKRGDFFQRRNHTQKKKVLHRQSPSKKSLSASTRGGKGEGRQQVPAFPSKGRASPEQKTTPKGGTDPSSRKKGILPVRRLARKKKKDSRQLHVVWGHFRGKEVVCITTRLVPAKEKNRAFHEPRKPKK